MINITTKQHILIVDDEVEIQRLIKRYFEMDAFTVHTVSDGKQMYTKLAQYPIKLIILDVQLPGKDGFTLLHELKRNSKIAVIILTSQGATRDRISGLEQGADDYLPKPFDMAELLARSKAVLRRLPTHPNVELPNHCFEFAGWKLLESIRQLINHNNQNIAITPAEFDLLACLLRHSGRVLSRDYLLQQTRGRLASPFDRTIDVRIGQIRKKLHACRPSQPLIKTIRNVGYLFDCKVHITTG